jgi:hypothetical protein
MSESTNVGDASALSQEQIDKLAEKAKEKERKRVLVLNEILTSEGNYVGRLKLTIEVFLTNFKENNVLTQEEIYGQFGPWEIIYGVNSKLLEDLTTAQSSGNMLVGKIFKVFSNFFKIYSDYLQRYEGAMIRRAKLLTSNKRFADVVERARQDPRCGGMTFDSFLVEPVQRIPRYRLLLEELLKCTPESHEDYSNIVEALASV